MNYQTIFKRYELKYLLTGKEREQLMKAMEPYMSLDEFGHSSIRNIYYDTDTYRLARRSIEQPAYKEKLRVRSYGEVGKDDTVFVELKKKYQSVVYKRRLPLHEHEAMEWLDGGVIYDGSQIAQEIEYFRDYYQSLHPVVFISYEREAYYPLTGGDFRVTFDENILCREENLSLCSDTWGAPLLENGQTLMELKTSCGIPLWMSRFLTEKKIYKTSFSKYGNAYQSIILPSYEGGRLYA